MTEPSRARPLTHREQWAQLLTTRQSPRRWAQIADAIRTADATRHDAFGDPIVRGGDAWCRLALTALERPSTETAGRYPTALPGRVLADADLLTAWLTAPAPHSDQLIVINADVVGVDDWVAVSDDHAHRSLAFVLNAAQDAGVYGVAGYRIEAFHVDVDSWTSHHLLVARPEFGPGLATSTIADCDLIPTGSATRIVGAVQLLTAIAGHINLVLDQRDRAAEIQPAVRRARARSFPPTPAREDSGPSSPQAPPPAPDRRRR